MDSGGGAGPGAVHIQLLGGFDVSAGGRSVAHKAWRLRKAKTLVKILALEPGHRMHRDRVTAQLWPDLDAAASRNNLHQVLHAARHAMSTIGVAGPAILGLRDDVVVLGPDCPVDTDLEELQRAVQQAHAPGAAHDAATLAGLFDRWGGGLLPEDGYESWAQVHVTAAREWHLKAVLDLVDDGLATRDPAGAVVLLIPVVAANPLHEPAHRALMRVLADAGRRSEALGVFEDLRELLRRDLAAEPEWQTRKLYRELLAGTADSAHPPVAGAAAAGNLPVRATTLVGRDREVRAIDGILARTHLLTLTGPGGVGKTALAVEVARRRAPHHPDGTFLVELGALASGDLVVSEVARALRLELPPHRASAESLVSQLRDRELLVVLDNCEHVLDECARIVTHVLQRCPRVSVLTTSREPLRIAGEVTWRTPSLALPDPAHLPPPDVLAGIASVQLFVRRASSAAGGFTLTEDNAAAVAEICYRLDGVPLALELAAACAPILSARQIAARLGDALTLLNRGDRSRVTRQQTLAATLAWSHDLLTGDEQVLFRRLAVFAGSFSLAAAEVVCAADPDRPRVLAELSRLVDTSLVLAEPAGDDNRYRLLETVRQYAAERLDAAGESGDVRARHCRWYVDYAEARDPEQTAAVLDVSTADLDAEHENVRLALDWGLLRDPEKALRLAVALWRSWLARGMLAEGCAWLERVLAAVPEPSPLRTRALYGLAVFDVRRGSAQRLEQIAAEGVVVERLRNDPAGLAQALAAGSTLAYIRGDWTECWQSSLQARDLALDCGAPGIAVSALHPLAMVLLGRGELQAARKVFDEITAGLPAMPRPGSKFFAPMMLGFAVEGATTPSPRVHFEETILLGRRVGADQAGAYVQCNVAYLARLAGDLEEARSLVEDALSAFHGLGDREGEALAVNHLGCLHRVQGDYAAARDAFERSLQLRLALGDRRATGLTLGSLGVLTAAEGNVDRGIGLLQEALSGFRDTEDAPALAAVRLTMASVYATAGADDQACHLLPEVLRESRRIPGNHRATAWGYAVLADVYRRLGRSNEAIQALRDAQELFGHLGAVDGAEHVRVAVRAQTAN